jgi:CubicO group peptidase (beta-lactamase class C family)
MKTILRVLLFAATSVVCFGAEPALRAAKPEEVGMSSERLKRVDAFVERLQAEGKLAGAVTAVIRRGRVVQLDAHGFADLEEKRAMRTDDIFQIQSMTKPVVTVAALMLLEEGRFLLSDPVDKYLPELRDMKVAVVKGDAPDGYELVPAARRITIIDLLTHRAGFQGVPPDRSPADASRRKAYQALPPRRNFTLEKYVKVVAAQPLDHQPGTTFRYGPATDVVARLVEVISGQPLDQFLRERIFQPLGMTDTGYTVPADKQARMARAYSWSADKGLVKLPLDPVEPRFFSGDSGLFSTAADYLPFCQMLLNEGELDGRRLLGRKTVELMTARHVESIPLPFMPGMHFGLGVAVRKEDGDAGLLGSPGTYGWGGGYNTYFRIDPQEKLILLLLAQRTFSPFDLELNYGFQNTVMQAIVD